jgi:hypothetical protein
VLYSSELWKAQYFCVFRLDIEMHRVKGTLRVFNFTLLGVKGHEALLTRLVILVASWSGILSGRTDARFVLRVAAS